MAKSTDPRIVVLAGAADLALETARHDAEDELAPPVPSMLRPMLTWRRGTRVAAARAAALAALDDDDFRARVWIRASQDGLDRASWLMIDRPDGWSDEVDREIAKLIDEHSARAKQREAAREQELADAVTQLRRQVAELADELSARESRLDEQTAEIAELRAELDRERGAVRTARAERQAAVRDLKHMERRLADRTAQWKAALAGAAQQPSPPVESRPDPAAVAAFDAVVLAHQELGEQLAALGESVRGDDGSTPQASSMPMSRAPERVRRRPVSMRRALRIDTVAGVDWLVRRPGAVVLIDGYNVTMTAWPTLSAGDQRVRLEQACAEVAVRTSASVVIVFDGDSTGGRPSRSAGSLVRVRYTADDVEADDEILDLIEQVPVDQPVIVVSNDRRVVDGAIARGANTVASTTWVELLAG